MLGFRLDFPKTNGLSQLRHTVLKGSMEVKINNTLLVIDSTRKWRSGLDSQTIRLKPHIAWVIAIIW